MSYRGWPSGVSQVDAASVPLLMLLGRLRCASYAHLKTLLRGSQPAHDLERVIESLFNENLIRMVELPANRRGYALTGRAIRAVPALRREFKPSAANITEKSAVRGWQRAALWTHYTRGGALVLFGDKARDALKDHFLCVLEASGDTFSPLVLGLLRESLDRCFAKAKASAAALDVAWFADKNECILLVADDPYKRMMTQLEGLPVAVSAYDRAEGGAAYLPPVSVVFVPSDVESRWDETKGVWACKGPRLRQWLRLTVEKKGHEGFPYHRVLLSVSPPAVAMLYRRTSPSRSFSHPSRVSQASVASGEI